MNENRAQRHFAEGYPPESHMLRDLRLSVELQAGGPFAARAPVAPEVCTDRGTLQLGVVAALADTLGGLIAVRSVYPDWAATAYMTVHTSGRAGSGAVSATASMIKAGNSMVFVDLDLFEAPDGAPRLKKIGSALLAFSKLPRRKDTLELGAHNGSSGVARFEMAGAPLTEPFLRKAGVRVLREAEGVVELEPSEYVLNSFRSLQGGMAAVLADVAGQCAARSAAEKDLLTSDLEIHYLSQGRKGPFRTRAEVVRRTAETVLTRVEVRDRGAKDRLISVAMNTAAL